MSGSLFTLMKLGVCGATIVCIGWAILILGGDGDVEETSADILSVNPVPLTNTARFENSLEALGHTEPRTYDLNGNEVAFSSRTTHKKPVRLVEEYQREFVRQGLNEETYIGLPSAGSNGGVGTAEDEGIEEFQTYREAMMSGQPIPLEASERHVTMGAGLIDRGVTTRRQLRNRLGSGDLASYAESFDGYRFIEAFRDPESGSTSVTAVWSRGDFDMTKNMPKRFPKKRGVNPSTDIPACIGCTRMMQFGGRANAEPNAVNIFETNIGPGRIAQFYDRAMRGRGWRPAASSRLVNEVLPYLEGVDPQTKFRQYSKGGESVLMRIRRDPTLDKTTVTTYQTKQEY